MTTQYKEKEVLDSLGRFKYIYLKKELKKIVK